MWKLAELLQMVVILKNTGVIGCSHLSSQHPRGWGRRIPTGSRLAKYTESQKGKKKTLAVLMNFFFNLDVYLSRKSEIQRKHREKSGCTSSKAIKKGMFPFQRVSHCGAWWPIDLDGLPIRWSTSDLHRLPIRWSRSVEKPGHSEPGGLNLSYKPSQFCAASQLPAI